MIGAILSMALKADVQSATNRSVATTRGNDFPPVSRILPRWKRMCPSPWRTQCGVARAFTSHRFILKGVRWPLRSLHQVDIPPQGLSLEHPLPPSPGDVGNAVGTVRYFGQLVASSPAHNLELHAGRHQPGRSDQRLVCYLQRPVVDR